MNSKGQSNHLAITVDVEEWFHTDFFDVEEVISKYYGGKYPRTDVVESVKNLLDLFDKHDVNATFFVLGETAEKYPELMNILEKDEHEIGCHAYYHNKKYEDLNNFRKDLQKFKKEIKKDVIGFRYPNYNISDEKLMVIKEVGFQYDSSIVPCRNIPGWYGNPTAPLIPYEIKLKNGKKLTEFPLCVSPILRLPGSGGWYLRNAGYWWTKHVIKASLKKHGYANLYVHPWEFSENNPKHKEIPFHVFRGSGEKNYNRIEKIIETLNNVEFKPLKDLV